MAETIVDLARRDREAAVRRVMTVLGIGRTQAERIIALELGETVGDMLETDEKGNAIDLDLPPSDWPGRGS